MKDYELIFVNDDSPDNIWAKIQTLAATDPHVKAISLRRNFGYDSALMAGLNYVRYPYVVIMDDDLQHAPEDIPLLLTEIEKGFDVVYGNFLVKKQSLVKNLGSWFVGKLAQLIVNNCQGNRKVWWSLPLYRWSDFPDDLFNKSNHDHPS